jgi:hypothetical protein
VPRAPVRAAVGQTVRNHSAVRAGQELAERDRAIGTQRVRIEQYARLRIEGLGDIKNALVLKPIVAQVEVAPAARDRNVVTLVVPQLRHARLDAFASGNRLEKRLCERVLRFDPRPHLRTRLVLEPAIGILDAHAMIEIDLIDPLRSWIVERGGHLRWRRWVGRTRNQQGAACAQDDAKHQRVTLQNSDA